MSYSKLKCPNCNSTRIAEILYGYPAYDEKMQKDLDEGKILLGGCCVTGNDTDYKCLNCKAYIYRKTNKFFFEDEDEKLNST